MIDSAKKNSADFDFHASDLTQPRAAFSSAEKSAQSKGEKYVIFCLGADFFAVSSDQVSEVVQMLAITPLPVVPEWILGISDLRGGIISVISLRKLLGASSAPVSPKTKFVVLKSPNSPAAIALAVDRLSEIVFIPIEEIQPLKDEKMPYLFGTILYNLKTLSLLNVENLLSSLTV